jgi:hypothetical protein
MSRELLLENFGKTSLLSGMPEDFSDYMIPAAVYFYAKGPWGILCLQEIKTHNYLLRHFLFSLKESISFFNEDGSGKLQSLLTIDGSFDFEIKDHEKVARSGGGDRNRTINSVFKNIILRCIVVFVFVLFPF